MAKYILEIDLAKLNMTEVMKKDVGGKEVEGVFIPFNYNNIYKKFDKLKIYLEMTEKKANVYNQSHMIKTRIPFSKKRKFEEMNLKTSQIIGSAVVYNKYYRQKNTPKLSIDDILSDDK